MRPEAIERVVQSELERLRARVTELVDESFNQSARIVCAEARIAELDKGWTAASQTILKMEAEHDRLAAKILRQKEGLEMIANLRDSEEARIARIYLN